MNVKQKGYWAMLIISLLIGYAIYQKANDEQVMTKQGQLIPDIVIKGTFSKHYNEKGELVYTLRSASVKHFQENGNFIFDHPHLIVYGSDLIAQWSIKAGQAILDTDQNIILNKTVKLTSLLTDSELKKFETSELVMNLATKEYYSDTEVTLAGEHFQIKAKSLQGNLTDNIIKLTQQVEGEYDIQIH